MRLINVDKLPFTEPQNSAYKRGWNDALWAVKEIPTIPAVDAVEVVRCRECKCYPKDFDEDSWNWCCGIGDDTKPNDFCSYGQRREDGLYESLKRGLEEAIAYENGEIECRTETREDGDNGKHL